MTDLLSSLLHLVFTKPQLVVGALWLWAARWGRRNSVPLWFLGVPVLLYVYRNRKDLRGMIRWVAGFVVTAVWVVAVLNPRTRWSVGIAVPYGLAVGGAVWLAQNYGQHPVKAAVRLAVAERRSREVVTDAVSASVGEQAKVLSVKDLGAGTFEATVVGPAGMSHVELVERLRESIAESILRQSGREMRNVDVVGNGAKGRVLLRCGTHDPYAATMTLSEVLAR